MTLPYPANNPQLDAMYKHFARRCYEDSHSTLRRAYHIGGVSGAYHAWKQMDDSYKAEKKMPFIQNAHLQAWNDFCRNCPELDITPIVFAVQYRGVTHATR